MRWPRPPFYRYSYESTVYSKVRSPGTAEMNEKDFLLYKSDFACRIIPKLFFKGKREMRQILKTHIDIDIGWLSLFFEYLVMGQFQSLLCEPFSRGSLKGFFKILFEGGQASAGEIAEFFQGEIEHIVLLHKFYQIQLTGFFELSKQVIHPIIDSTKHADRLFYFEGGNVGRQGVRQFKIGQQGTEEAFQ